jgi:hypothetical protein
MDESLVGRDVYIRVDGGPVQHVRSWNPGLFLETRMADARKATPPQRVELASADEYKAEHRRK